MHKLAFKDAKGISEQFVEARLAGRALPDFPGSIPASLQDAYSIQKEAIDLWPDDIAGWKIGRVPAHQLEALGSVRLAGPIFRKRVHRADGTTPVDFPVIRGGFAAAEGEIVFRCAFDAPKGKAEWSIEEARNMVETAYLGVEIAGSPLATINDLGATVVVSDFGNNAGLIVGAPVDNWEQRLEGLACATRIDGRTVGEATLVSLREGPLESLRFLLAHLGAFGLPLRKGAYVTTGAITGVHEFAAGQTAVCSFGDIGEIQCRAI